MGVTIQPVTEELAQSFGLKQAKGALVNDVIKGGPADKAGVRQGDVITALNGKEVKDPSHLQRQVAEAGVGTVAKISIFREGKALELSITLASADTAPKQRQRAQRSGRQQEGGADLLGLIVDNAESGDGVVVVDAVSGGVAAEAGIKRGDVIVSVNRKRTATTAEYSRAIQQSGRAGTLTILVRRGDASIYFALRRK
jgi:serine protease Do/serine protease DegQ